MNRRQALAAVAGVAVGGPALWNTALGYRGPLGTNVLEQPIEELAARGLEVRETILEADGYTIRADQAGVAISGDDGREESFELATASADSVADVAAETTPLLETVWTDLSVLSGDRYSVSVRPWEAFTTEVGARTLRPTATALVRSPTIEPADPNDVRAFTGGSPASTIELIESLGETFRERTTYDDWRYLLGSIDDYLVPFDVDLRSVVGPDATDFATLATREETALFCTELSARTIEAVYASAPEAQSVPMTAGWVMDTRHRHHYVALATAVSDGDGIELLVTLIDYTDVVKTADAHLEAVVSTNPNAVDRYHRADGIYWAPGWLDRYR